MTNRAPMLPAAEERLFTITEWSAHFGFTERATRELIAKRAVSVAKIGRRVYLTLPEGRRLIAENTRPAIPSGVSR